MTWPMPTRSEVAIHPVDRNSLDPGNTLSIKVFSGSVDPH
jgi:hypothetical protein